MQATDGAERGEVVGSYQRSKVLYRGADRLFPAFYTVVPSADQTGVETQSIRFDSALESALKRTRDVRSPSVPPINAMRL
jgi:hypothetical protein